jgi:hypothetical protein
MSSAIIFSWEAFIALKILTPVVVGFIGPNMRDLVSLEVLPEGEDLLTSGPLALVPSGSNAPCIARVFARRTIRRRRSEFWKQIIEHGRT